MGDQHRSDSNREEHAGRDRNDAAKRASQRDADDAQFDPAHANTQLAYHAKTTFETSRTTPAKTVEAVGESHYLRLEDAINAKNPTDAITVVRQMNTEQRRSVANRLDELSEFMSVRELLIFGELAEATVDQTILATLEARPPITRAQARAFLADVGYAQLDSAFKNKHLTPALRKQFPGSPIELIPQLGIDGMLRNQSLLTWLLETTPIKTVARLMLDIDPEWVSYQAVGLDSLGEDGWKWLEAVDAQMAAVTDPQTLLAYKRHAEGRAKRAKPDDPVIDDAKQVQQLDRLEKSASVHAASSTAKVRAEANALRARRSEVIAKSTPLQIQQQTQHAGLDATEQFEWILDKPRLTAAQLREATTVIQIDKIYFSTKTIAKLQKRFPKMNPEELFSGGFPADLSAAGARDHKTARWLLQGAAPETTLRLVATHPDLIDEWCDVLVAVGIGFGWVQQLGGTQTDYLLRRFALKCPDPATRQFIEERLLGTGANPGTTKTTPVAAPDAYSSARSHLDSDLDRVSKFKPPAKTDEDGQNAHEQRSATIAADLGELKPDELAALRRDAARLKQILAIATQKTFPQILEYVQPELQVAVVAITNDNIRAADFVAWARTRPAREVTYTLSNPIYVERMQEIIGTLGPLDAFPPLASPDVLSRVLHANPSIINWMMASDPSQMLRAFAAPSVIDAAVRALAELEDISDIDKWPSAAALGNSGRSVLVQMSARAKGQLKEALDERLKAKLPSPPVEAAGEDEFEPLDDADANALAVNGRGALKDRLADLLERQAPPSTILALTRSRGVVQTLIENPELANALKGRLQLPPDLVLSASLSQLLQHTELHSWILKWTSAHRVLNATDTAVETLVAATLDRGGSDVDAFLEGLPRGRALSAANKAKLHRLSKLLKRDAHVEKLFAITFDTPVSELSRAEVDKLWATLALLPGAHVDQRSISKFMGTANSPDNTTAGLYRPDTQAIELQQGKLGSKDAAQYDHPVYMTEDEAVATVGSKEDLTRMVQHQVMKQNDDGTYSFVRQSRIETFPHTILHEVGHAVDYMLGAQTQLIYELAGWKRFQHGDFDGWATELGGWDGVAEADKKEIRKVWISWLAGGAKGTVWDMVDSDHPSVAPRYAKVGVVELAREEILDSFTSVNGLFASASHSKQSWMTISQKGYYAAPSGYALTAPEEYFAECYADYYRELTAAPNTAVTKGATLVPWIKGWFDTYVDKAGHNPLRNGRR